MDSVKLDHAQKIGDNKRWYALVAFLIATFLSIVNVFVTFVAIPVIQDDLQATGAQMTLIIAVYNLAFGILLIPGGRLGDMFGRKRLFLIGLSLFTLSSGLASITNDANVLIGYRIFQGIGAALMMPQIVSMIQLYFTGKERGVALGAFAAVGGVGSTVAQLIGGWLIQVNLFDLGWHLIYLMNVTVGVLAILLVIFLVEENKVETKQQEQKKRIDVIGIFLISIGLLLLMLPLILGNELGWPSWVFVSFVLSFVFIWLFVRYEKRINHAKGIQIIPLIQISLFQHRSFSIGNLFVILFYMGNASLFFLIPVFLQKGLSFTPFESGLVFALPSITFVLTSIKSGGLISKFGNKLILSGLSILGLSYLVFLLVMFFFDTKMSGYELIIPLVLSGIGMGLLSAPFNFISLKDVKEIEVGSASGILTAGQEIAYALGTVMAGIIFLGFENISSITAFNYTIVFNILLTISMFLLFPLLPSRQTGKE